MMRAVPIVCTIFVLLLQLVEINGRNTSLGTFNAAILPKFPEEKNRTEKLAELVRHPINKGGG
jgi:hypothetical protein